MVGNEEGADRREQAKWHWRCNGKDVIAGGPDSEKEKIRAIMAPLARGCKTKFLCTNTTEKQALNRLISP